MLIDKQVYMAKLVEVVDAQYPITEWRKINPQIIETKVYKEMSDYVQLRFLPMSIEEKQKLIEEHKRVIRECLEQLCINSLSR